MLSEVGPASARNGLGVDLEDWYALVTRRLHGREITPSQRVNVATQTLLDLLDASCTKATFFVLGAVAKAYPALVRDVHARGHEIASHGYGHQRLDRLDRESFRLDLRLANAAIAEACGVRPSGHRAPEFTVMTRTSWAFEILVEEGFKYDSSVFPIRHRRYGIPDAPRAPYVVETRAGPITEFPLATFEVLGQRLPTAGGGYLRMLPYALVKAGVDQAGKAGVPAILYVHPYEFDPEPLRMDTTGLKGRLFVAAQNALRDRSAPRLASLLRDFHFVPLGTLIEP